MSDVRDLYTIQILYEDGHVSAGFNPPNMEAFMAEIEENLTDLLPAGYRARIRRWDHPDPDELTQEEDDE